MLRGRWTDFGAKILEGRKVTYCPHTHQRLIERSRWVMVLRRFYFDLKKRLHDDYCNIPLVIPATRHNQLT